MGRYSRIHLGPARKNDPQVREAEAAASSAIKPGTFVVLSSGRFANADANTVGKKIYETSCFACHATGVANAPKTHDQAAWAPYVATGMDTMVEIAIHGKGAMPPRGGSQASDAEVHAAVQYMVHASQ